MNSDLTAEQLAQRIYDCRLLEMKQINAVLAEIGGRGVDCEKFKATLTQKELVTNWQMTRVLDGQKRGYIYGDWKVLYLVGSGTFARVYRAVHRQNGEMKAVKVLRIRYENDEDTQRSFLREGKMVQSLRHANIVPIYEVATQNNRSYMVMDFIEGQNLRDFVKAHGKLQPLDSLRIARDIARGLAFAASRGVQHRDVKLSNVLLTTQGKAMLVDFGLAVADNQPEQGEGVNPRSVDYAGLEKLTNVNRNDKRSDVYFLGCMLYHMLCGESPLLESKKRSERMAADRFRNVKPITQVAPNLSHRAVVVMQQLMELDPKARTQTPAEAVEILEAAIAAIEGGDSQKYSEELAKRDEEKFKKQTEQKSEGKGLTIMVIESKAEVQNLMRERLRNLGYRVLIMSDPNRAIDRFTDIEFEDELPADLVIFGCAGLKVAGLKAFNQFATGEFTSRLPAILLVPEKILAATEIENLAPHRMIGKMPIQFKQIRAAIRHLLKPKEANAEKSPPDK